MSTVPEIITAAHTPLQPRCLHHEYGGRGFGSAVVSKEVMETGKIAAGRVAALINGLIEQIGKMN